MNIHATYRLQLTKDFTFQDAANIIDYLEDVGFTHLYLSPIFESAPSSKHGYDAMDFSKISAERGGVAGFEFLCAEIKRRNSLLRLILDIVPNHMACDPRNPYWSDILAKGKDSQYWGLFDIRTGDDNKIHLPILGQEKEMAFKQSEIQITTSDPPALKYADHIFPLNEKSIKSLQKYPDMAVENVLAMQYYDLVYWAESQNFMTYRRFFDVTGLVGLRIEDSKNFVHLHHALEKIVQETDLVDGVRVDHIDGLSNPAEYLYRLHRRFENIWIEKILGSDERLRAEWPVTGTTGYEFIDHINRLFINGVGLAEMTRNWLENIEPCWKDFQSCILQSKADALKQLFGSELNRIIKLTGGDTFQTETFWSAITICLPVYRTYIIDIADETDKKYILQACEMAAASFKGDFEKSKSIYLHFLLNPQTDLQKKIAHEWQQLTGPVMAKGLEDTAHYRYTPLTALNEVGCDADAKAYTPDEFFKWLTEITTRYPLTLKATSTHDTKRSEDTRNRLYALTYDPQAWFELSNSLSDRVSSYKSSVTTATKDFLYQTLVATWPMDHQLSTDYKDRIKSFMQKAAREAKLHTSWLTPNKAYEADLEAFITKLLDDPVCWQKINSFTTPLAWTGALISLSVQAIKILSPGIPDFYQGSELWNFNLVDPDNRRLVDFEKAKALLLKLDKIEKESGRAALLDYLTMTWQDGGIKLWLIKILLDIRKTYLGKDFQAIPVAVIGENVDSLLAWRLQSKTIDLLVVCSRPTDVDGNANVMRIQDDTCKGASLMLDKVECGHNLITKENLNSQEICGSGKILKQFPIAVLLLNALPDN